jgi:hypothetical protein
MGGGPGGGAGGAVGGSFGGRGGTVGGAGAGGGAAGRGGTGGTGGCTQSDTAACGTRNCGTVQNACGQTVLCGVCANTECCDFGICNPAGDPPRC